MSCPGQALSRRRCLIAALGIVPLAAALPALAESPAGDRPLRHSTDEATRAAMVAIRDLVADNHSLVTHRRMPRATAMSMHSKVARQIAIIKESSRLGGDPRMELAQILEQLDQGAKAIAGLDKKISPIDGIVSMDEALAQYAHQFDHPGWKSPREL